MHVESLGLACSAIDSVQYDVNEGLHRNPGGKQICMYVCHAVILQEYQYKYGTRTE